MGPSASTSFVTEAFSVVSGVPARLSADRSAVDRALERLREELDVGGGPVEQAMRYALAGGGKRMRAILFLAAYRAAGGTGDASGLAAALEVVHAYSLVHDDLPCMDDDDVRRGRPTVHRAFGVPAATAAGIAMVPLAVLAAHRANRALRLPPRVSRAIVQELMRASGAGGMIGGQLLDLEGEGLALSVEQLESIHRAKTGALIVASVRLGGLAACASDGDVEALGRYGASIGLAFQIADDVLDVTATTDELGKTAGRDAALRKSTYPLHLGLEGAKDRARRLVDEACTILREAGLLTPELEHLARFAIARRS